MSNLLYAIIYVIIVTLLDLLDWFGQLRFVAARAMRRFWQRCRLFIGQLISLLPDTAEQKRYFWTVLAILTTMLTAAMLALLTVSCTKSKKESSSPVAVPVDSTRLRLQRQVQTADSAVIVAKDSTLKTQKPYEDAVSDYLLWRSLLGN